LQAKKPKMPIQRTLRIAKTNPVVTEGNKIMANNAIKDLESGEMPREQLTPQRAEDL